MSEAKTTKKVRIVGTQDYINPQTGEFISMQVTSIEERDFNFHKIWMRSFLATLDLVGNQKSKVAYWIIEHINRENMLPCTYRQIASATGISLETVRRTMQVLLDANFLRRINQGCYIINPDIMFKGTRAGRLNVLTQFSDASAAAKPEPSPEERLQNLLQAIQQLTEQANKLSNEIKAAQKKTPLPGQIGLDELNDELKEEARGA